MLLLKKLNKTSNVIAKMSFHNLKLNKNSNIIAKKSLHNLNPNKTLTKRL